MFAADLFGCNTLPPQPGGPALPLVAGVSAGVAAVIIVICVDEAGEGEGSIAGAPKFESVEEVVEEVLVQLEPVAGAREML